MDGGPSPINSDHCELFISVEDVNEFSPVFPVRFFYSKKVTENQPIGTFVFSAQASDKDAGYYGVIRYQMVSLELSKYSIND